MKIRKRYGIGMSIDIDLEDVMTVCASVHKVKIDQIGLAISNKGMTG